MWGTGTRLTTDFSSDYVIIDYIGNYVSAHYYPSDNSSGYVQKMFRAPMVIKENKIPTFMFNNKLGTHCTPRECSTSGCSAEIQVCREQGNQALRSIEEHIINSNAIGKEVLRNLRRYEIKYLNNLRFTEDFVRELNEISTPLDFYQILE